VWPNPQFTADGDNPPLREELLDELYEEIETLRHELTTYYQGITIDALQIMSNHLHGIIILHHPAGATPCARPDHYTAPCARPSNRRRDEENGQARGRTPGRPYRQVAED
jgi:REP element-mobilizing transposase RayT